jgi:flavin reductase (DIM6/NTAB) family NADH-FMN oxidoreductase RutF
VTEVPPPVGPARFRDALARYVSSVHVVTTAGAAGEGGVTATAVCAVSDAPATVLVCLHRDSRLHAMIEGNGVLAVNTLARHEQALADVFAGRLGLSMEERLRHGAWVRLGTGSPVLAGAVAALDCRVECSQVVGTHRVFFARVMDTHACSGAQTLVYGERRYGVYEPV